MRHNSFHTFCTFVIRFEFFCVRLSGRSSFHWSCRFWSFKRTIRVWAPEKTQREKAAVRRTERNIKASGDQIRKKMLAWAASCHKGNVPASVLGALHSADKSTPSHKGLNNCECASISYFQLTLLPQMKMMNLQFDDSNSPFEISSQHTRLHTQNHLRV